ncbi:MAG: hypothetical protein ACETWM_07990 [Candidatus Lokiarchaeia archaeon]
MRFWDETSIGKVSRRLWVLSIVVGIPGLASLFQLIGLDSYKFFLPFQTKGLPVNLNFAVISPLEVMFPTLSPSAVPAGDPYVLLLTIVFLASIAGIFFIHWCRFFMQAAKYTPGYNTFRDVKSALRSLLPGAGKNRRMFTREDNYVIKFSAFSMIAGYIGIAIFFVIAIAKLNSNFYLVIIALPCIVIWIVGAFFLSGLIRRGLEPPEK